MFKFNDIAEQALEFEKQYYLTEFEIGDAIQYYWPSIERAIADLRMQASWDTDNPVYSDSCFPRMSQDQAEIVIDYLYNNAADLLSIGYDYHIVSGYYALASCDEIEIDLNRYHWTDTRRAIVSRWSDIYVSENNFGYISGGFHLDIELRLDEIDSAIAESEAAA